MSKYVVVISGTVESIHNTREEAEVRLAEIRNSFYALVHPVDCMYITEAPKPGTSLGVYR